MVRVLGENGVGKTTFLRTLAGLHVTLAGQVVWHDKDRAVMADASMLDTVCYVAHENGLNGAPTLLENLAFLMRVAGRPTSSRRICDVLSELGLAVCGTRPIAYCLPVSSGEYGVWGAVERKTGLSVKGRNRPEAVVRFANHIWPTA